MIVQINIGGIMISFGEPTAPIKPEPFYPYLDSVNPIQDATGDETGSTGFTLKMKAKQFMSLNLRRAVVVRNDALEIQFQGIIGRIAYKEGIEVTVEA